jgi:2-(3-amino-3-carboxypropyl)histidine synthase
MAYDLELTKVIAYIKEKKAERVIIQLPEGLKNQALKITDRLESETNAEIIIWAGTCFGACDIPPDLEKNNIDLLIQWGHSEWNK